MWRANRRVLVLLGLSLVAAISISVLAQDNSAVEKLAQRTAEELVKRKPTVLLIAPRESCNLDLQICQTFDSLIRLFVQTYGKKSPIFDLLGMPKPFAI